MIQKRAKALVKRKIEELKGLSDKDPDELFVWHSSTLGELTAVLSGASRKKIATFQARWKDNGPDRTFWELRNDEDCEYDDDDQVVIFQWQGEDQELYPSEIMRLLQPSTFRPPDDIRRCKSAKLLLGSTSIPDDEEGYNRFRWQLGCLDLMLEANAINAESESLRGEDPSDSARATDESPKFERFTKESENGEMIAKIIRSRWRAAQDLQSRGHYREACIFYGSLFEALLVAYLEQFAGEDLKMKYGKNPKDQRGNLLPARKWSKDNLFNAANDAVGLTSIVRGLQDSIKDYRDLIHIHAEKGLVWSGQSANSKLSGLHYETNREASEILERALGQLINTFQDSLRLPGAGEPKKTPRPAKSGR